MTGLSLANSPLTLRSYGLNNRLAFLYGALRTRSQFARTELARLAESSVTAKLDLAWLISNQATSESDLRTAMITYLEVLKQHGFDSLKHMHSADLAILATKLGDDQIAQLAAARTSNLYALVKNLLPKHLKTIPMQGIQEAMHATLFASKDFSVASEFLKLDIANPLRGLSHESAQLSTQTTETRDWLSKLNSELISRSIEPLEFAQPTAKWQSPFDLLTANVAASTVSGPKVTVVMSAFKPDSNIFTAVHSALNQSYANLEVLVIDDCSPKEFDAIFDEVAKLDSRIKVLRQSVNGGTYRIRNRALDEATGEYITFQDSDDYMHPRRIELQVADLEKHRKKVANVSLSTRLTDRLEAIESNRRLRIGICEPALMFRRVQVRDRIGYFDSVRKSADSEYRKRIMKVFGHDLTAVHPFKILTVQRADNGGLTQGELGFRWITEFRLVYRDAYLNFHRTGGKSNWHIDRDGERPFYAPRYSLEPAAKAREPQEFDLVLIANLRDGNQIPAVQARVSSANQAGLRVGLLQVNSLYPLNRKMGTIKAPIIELLNAGSASMVFVSDAIKTKTIEVMAPSTFAVSYSGEVYPWQIGEVKIAAAPEAFNAKPLEPLLEHVLKQATFD